MNKPSSGGEKQRVSPFVIVVVSFVLLVFGLVGGYIMDISGGANSDPEQIALPIAAEKVYARATENY